MAQETSATDVVAIVVTHNRLPLLPTCVAAIRSQVPRPGRLVVVDSGSNDGTPEWLMAQKEELGDWLTVVRQANCGSAGAYHTAFDTALALGAATVVPGLVDTHVHGGAGADFFTADPAQTADAVALLATLRGGGMDARLWMPGARARGRERYLAEIEALAAASGVSGAMAMTPPTSEIAAAYAASDLVLQLSRKPEAFGRTVVEALSCGRPVLGWDHGGSGELLRELQPGGVAPPFDAAALALAARNLLERAPSLPDTIPFTLQAMQDATLSVYDELRPASAAVPG